MAYDERSALSRENSLYTDAEAAANIFNIKCLTIMAVLIVLCDVLNEIDVFHVPLFIMRASAALGCLTFLCPLIILLLHDVLLKKAPSVARDPRFKILITVIAYCGVAILGISLSNHAVVALALPSLVAAQYRDQKKLFTIVIILTVVLVPLTVYGSFFFGSADRNLLKVVLSDEEAADLSLRLSLATPKRMAELFYHHALPRMIGILAINILASGISRRNNKMLSKQAELSETVRREMERENEMQGQVIDGMASVIETRDASTGDHVKRTKRYVTLLINEMRRDPRYADVLSDENAEMISGAAPLHDIGKIAVSDTILLKPGKLTAEEFEKMKTHTTEGRKMIKSVFGSMDNELFKKTAEDIAVSHHEKWDGSGYPNAASGKDIPLSARIRAVADVYDALVSERVYKKPIPAEKAFEIIKSESGSHFDPDVVDAMMRIKDKFTAGAEDAPRDR